MARWLDAFPRRQTDPTWRAETYVDRAIGMPDPAEMARAERARQSAARSVQRTQVIAQDVVPDYNTMRSDTLYRAANMAYLRGRDSLIQFSDVRLVTAFTGETFVVNGTDFTYVTHLTTTTVLPAGTWSCTVMFWGTYVGNTGAVFIVDVRISEPAIGDVNEQTGNASSRATTFTRLITDVVSDGVTAITFTVHFKMHTGSVDAIRADSSFLLAICQRAAE